MLHNFYKPNFSTARCGKIIIIWTTMSLNRYQHVVSDISKSFLCHFTGNIVLLAEQNSSSWYHFSLLFICTCGLEEKLKAVWWCYSSCGISMWFLMTLFPCKRLDFSTGIHFSSIPPIFACQLITETPEHKITHMHGQSAPGLGGHCVLDDCLCVGVCEPEFFDGKQPTERDTRLSRWCERRTNSMKQEPDMTRKKRPDSLRHKSHQISQQLA